MSQQQLGFSSAAVRSFMGAVSKSVRNKEVKGNDEYPHALMDLAFDKICASYNIDPDILGYSLAVYGVLHSTSVKALNDPDITILFPTNEVIHGVDDDDGDGGGTVGLKQYPAFEIFSFFADVLETEVPLLFIRRIMKYPRVVKFHAPAFINMANSDPSKKQEYMKNFQSFSSLEVTSRIASDDTAAKLGRSARQRGRDTSSAVIDAEFE